MWIIRAWIVLFSVCYTFVFGNVVNQTVTNQTAINQPATNQTDSPSYLSPRALQAIISNQGWVTLNKTLLSKPYDRDRYPDGIINMGLAENHLTHEELAKYLESNFTIDPLEELTYGQGAAASPRLRKALTSFFNSEFRATPPVAEGQIIVASGITSLIDNIAWCVCSDGEGVLIPRPLYNSFPADLKLRSEGKLLPTSFVSENGTYSIHDAFNAAANRKSLELAFNHYTLQGIKVKGVIITNPHNPLGQCYDEETLTEIARFCNEHQIHFISDEIYANSVFENKQFPDATKFTSVLSLNLDGIIDPNLVHMMYGMSKDFGASGFRLGALVSRNQQLINAAWGVNLFSWPSYLAQDMWARILDDSEFLKTILDLNRQRLAQSYSNLTAYLDRQQISYYRGGNAGLFLWARVLKYDPRNATVGYTELKERFMDVCKKNGVFVQDGDVFYAEGEDKGWFRITFSFDLETLQVGFNRLTQSIKEIKAVFRF